MKIFQIIKHTLEANKLESVANRLQEEFPHNSYSHKLRVEAEAHRVEADIAAGKIIPINSEYID